MEVNSFRIKWKGIRKDKVYAEGISENSYTFSKAKRLAESMTKETGVAHIAIADPEGYHSIPYCSINDLIIKDYLLTEYVQHKARSFGQNHPTLYDEIHSSGWVALAKAVTTWNPYGAADMHTYANNILKNNAIDIKRIYDRKVAKEYRSSGIFEEATRSRTKSEDSNPEEIYIEKEEIRQVLCHVDVVRDIWNWTERERYIFFHHIYTDNRMSMRGLAFKFKCSKSSINRDKIRILKQIKEAIDAYENR